MITKIGDKLYIGDSQDERYADLTGEGITAVLNVAQDMDGTRGWLWGIEYAQVGLVDGPGNPPASYYAAVLALVSLLKRHRTLVVCHTGGRSLAVAMMYLNIRVRRSWTELLTLVRERMDVGLPQVHEAHQEVFKKMNYKLLDSLTGD